MVTRLIAEMVQSGLLARRGKQYVLLKKWDFSERVPASARRLAGLRPFLRKILEPGKILDSSPADGCVESRSRFVRRTRLELKD